MKIERFGQASLYYTGGARSWGILIDPADQWDLIQTFTSKYEIKVRYLLVTSPTFEKSFEIARIQQESGSKFLAFKSDLLVLRNLPREADRVNVCGVKIPHVDRFLDDLKSVELDGVKIGIKVTETGREYRILNEADRAEITHES